VSPEAAAGGPIALIEPGDMITVDIPARSLHLHVSEEELARRRSVWQPLVRPGLPSYLQRYAKLVTSGSQGAVLAW
ncbi:MAG: dihydroxy-acid dehydratase, partial [Anaerolineae bacterium]|nr:dihydroxy-acid dehydratase [Anaerolineae bacterium]